MRYINTITITIIIIVIISVFQAIGFKQKSRATGMARKI